MTDTARSCSLETIIPVAQYVSLMHLLLPRCRPRWRWWFITSIVAHSQVLGKGNRKCLGCAFHSCVYCVLAAVGFKALRIVALSGKRQAGVQSGRKKNYIEVQLGPWSRIWPFKLHITASRVLCCPSNDMYWQRRWPADFSIFCLFKTSVGWRWAHISCVVLSQYTV